MSKPCENCGADPKVCKDCEIYNGYVSLTKIKQMRDEFISLGNTGWLDISLSECLEIIDKYTNGKDKYKDDPLTNSLISFCKNIVEDYEKGQNHEIFRSSQEHLFNPDQIDQDNN